MIRTILLLVVAIFIVRGFFKIHDHKKKNIKGQELKKSKARSKQHTRLLVPFLMNLQDSKYSIPKTHKIHKENNGIKNPKKSTRDESPTLPFRHYDIHGNKLYTDRKSLNLLNEKRSTQVDVVHILKPEGKNPFRPVNKEVEKVQGGSSLMISKGSYSDRVMSKKNTSNEIHRKKDLLPESSETLVHSLYRNTLECLICTEPISNPSAKHKGIWQCKECYKIFHFKCISSWSSKSIKDEVWHCPNCRFEYHKIPVEPFCFCGKKTNPKVKPFLIPYSCGSICEKKLKNDKKLNCEHTCNLFCHPGSCPPCERTLNPENCYCGKSTMLRKCGEATTGFSCKGFCRKLLSCGIHYCQKTCHSDECGKCNRVAGFITCVCEKVKNIQIQCGEKHQISQRSSCGSVCNKLLDCQKHFCNDICHTHQPNATCPYDPSVLKHCPCGKTKTIRTGCTDPIYTCSFPCNKILPCGHLCSSLCHTGECSDLCREPISIRCCCGNKERITECHKKMEDFKCESTCQTKRACKLHVCRKKCCPGDAHSHQCHIICGKILNCKIHTCNEICHPSKKCPRCLQADFNEWSCHCGQTKMMPPILCGTKIPECAYSCIRSECRENCAHPNIYPCHDTTKKCPPCIVLVDASCTCGKKTMRGWQCWKFSANLHPSCNEPCSKELVCGHSCQKFCHHHNVNDIIECFSLCGKKREPCGHLCSQKCHSEFSCSVYKCMEAVNITCDCGVKKESALCYEITTSYKVGCDGECLKKSRLEALKHALNIDDPQITYIDDHFGVALENMIININSMTMDELKQKQHSFSDLLAWKAKDELIEFTMNHEIFVKKVEGAIFNFLNPDSHRVWLDFAPMSSPKRKFIKHVASIYGLAFIELDTHIKEKTSVRVGKNSDSKVPMVLLSELVKVLKVESSAPLIFWKRLMEKLDKVPNIEGNKMNLNESESESGSSLNYQNDSCINETIDDIEIDILTSAPG